MKIAKRVEYLITDVDEFDHIADNYLCHAPLALCLREINRLFALKDLLKIQELRSPILDVGCGDGKWWNVINNSDKEIYGIDISKREVHQAKQFINADIVDISKEIPFKNIKFKDIIGNCTFEHIRDIDSALENLNICADDGARLILFVPTPSWAFQGYTQSFLLKHFPRLAMTISGAFNGFFQHWHLYDIAVWDAILNNNGWNVKEYRELGNSRSEFLFRLFIPPSFFGFIFKTIFGHYPNKLLKIFPSSCLIPMKSLLRWALFNRSSDVMDHSKAYEYVILAEKS